jgi:hypothetical protein
VDGQRFLADGRDRSAASSSYRAYPSPRIFPATICRCSATCGRTSARTCRRRGAASGDLDPLKLPTRLQTALGLYGHYEQTFKLWRDAGIKVPPCFIIVCSNTSVSKLVYDYVSGYRTHEDGSSTLSMDA